MVLGKEGLTGLVLLPDGLYLLVGSGAQDLNQHLLIGTQTLTAERNGKQ